LQQLEVSIIFQYDGTNVYARLTVVLGTNIVRSFVMQGFFATMCLVNH